MARTARHTGRQAAVVGLLIAAACATVQPPPGGPPDFAPPVLLRAAPDSGAVLPGFDDEVEFAFDEVVTEGSGDALRQLIRVSPRHREMEVSWHRSRLTVKPGGGWRDSATYVVTLLPGVTDLRNNRLDSGRTIVFSTGGPIPETTLSGTVVDWEGGRAAPRALVEMIRPADSLTYWTQSDSTGAFTLSAVPSGAYTLVATIDQNSNRERDRREAFDSVTVTLDSALSRSLWAFVHDTVGPRISVVQFADSTALRVEFNQPLRPDSLPPFDGIELMELPDSTPVPIARTVWPAVYDSIQAAIRDSLSALRDSLAADSAARDTAARDTVAIETPLLTPSDTAAAAPDTTAMQRLLSERQPLRRVFVVIVDTPLQPGGRYLVRATVANPLDITDTSLGAVVVPAPPDST